MILCLKNGKIQYIKKLKPSMEEWASYNVAMILKDVSTLYMSNIYIPCTIDFYFKKVNPCAIQIEMNYDFEDSAYDAHNSLEYFFQLHQKADRIRLTSFLQLSDGLNWFKKSIPELSSQYLYVTNIVSNEYEEIRQSMITHRQNFEHLITNFNQTDLAYLIIRNGRWEFSSDIPLYCDFIGIPIMGTTLLHIIPYATFLNTQDCEVLLHIQYMSELSSEPVYECITIQDDMLHDACVYIPQSLQLDYLINNGCMYTIELTITKNGITTREVIPFSKIQSGYYLYDIIALKIKHYI